MYTKGMTIAEVLADTLASKDVTQEQAAASLGVSQPVISRWVAGKDTPRDEAVPALMKFTGLSQAKVLEAIHRQRTARSSLPGRVTRLEAQLATVQGELQRVVELLEALAPPTT